MLKELDAFRNMHGKNIFFGIVIFRVILSLSSSISPKEISNLKRICRRSMEVGRQQLLGCNLACKMFMKVKNKGA